MEREEVPVTWHSLQCTSCREFLAAPPDQTTQERDDMMDAHRQLCRARKAE